MNELSIFERDGKALVNSRDVSAKSGKQHAHILRDIDNILKNMPDPNLDWAISAPYIDENGVKRRSFDITKDMFTMLAMGWTGPKWIQAKIRWIEQFNWMEAELARQGHVDVSALLSELAELKRAIQGSTSWVTAFELVRQYHFGGEKDRGYIARAISNALTRHCHKNGYVIKYVPGISRDVKEFPTGPAGEFMTKFGKDTIKECLDRLAKRRGTMEDRQGVLEFPKSKK